MKVTIKHRITNAIIIEGDYESIKEALEKNHCAYLGDADLRGADLRGADLSGYQICPETGSFDAWKALVGGVIVKIRIPAKAKRTSSLIGRKCRAEFVKVLKGNGEGRYDGTAYTEGQITRADSFDPDPRVECSHGIHFFITKKEAEEY